MGSLQNLFLSSAAMTFTWGIWEIQLRHLALTPHHNRVLLWVCAPGQRLPLWALPWHLAQVLVYM